MNAEFTNLAASSGGTKSVIGEYTLPKLVGGYTGGIRIPMIQRDYAQGRASWESSRNRFLTDIKKALDGKKTLHLDFVYGIKQDEDCVDAFCPLDGQQRLTTLFLLHWYLAARDGRLDEFRKTFQAGSGLSKLTYQVRPGGRSFFGALVEHAPEPIDCEKKKPQDWIREQFWFRSIWDLDPSVAGTLVMLDAIHEQFKDAPQSGYEQLVNGNRITFQVLDLDAASLHDDLYLRMNARGRPLSTFETFKARYEKHLSGHPVPSAKDFSKHIDGKWLDFIWSRYGPKESTSSETGSVDAAFINLFRAVALASLPPRSNDEVKEDAAVILLSQGEPDYDDFESGEWIGAAFTVHLVHVLEALTGNYTGQDSDIFGNQWFSSGGLLDRVVRHKGNPDLTDYLQFAACVRFVTRHGPELDAAKQERFNDWMRVTRNLITNSEVRAERFRQVLAGLDQLLEGSWDIHPFLSTFTGRLTGINEQQLDEERWKAMLIQTAGWAPLIEKAEDHGYFRGQIDFLLEFSGAHAGEIGSWTSQDHADRQRKFLAYLDDANEMFDERGFKAKPDFLWERAFLANIDFLGKAGHFIWSFLNDDVGSAPAWKQTSWKRLLRDNDARRKHLQALWDRMATEHLEDIATTPTAEPWRNVLCSLPLAWDYCEQRLIRYEERWGKPARVFLLSAKQRRAAYAELFTFHLREQESLQTNRSRFAPLEFIRLADDTGLENSPHLVFEIEFSAKKRTLQLHCQHQDDTGFSLWIPASDLEPEFLRLLEGADFVAEMAGGTEFLVNRQEPGDPLDGAAYLDVIAGLLRQPS